MGLTNEAAKGFAFWWGSMSVDQRKMEGILARVCSALAGTLVHVKACAQPAVASGAFLRFG